MAGRTTGIEVRGTAGVYTGEGHDHVATEGADLRLASATRLADTPVALLRECAAPAILAVHESVPLPLLIRRVNKNSDNEWAERVLEAAGAETYGGSANTAKGVRALRDALTDLGVPSSGYSPANGSGLGHQNRVAPATMADLLRKLYFDPRGRYQRPAADTRRELPLLLLESEPDLEHLQLVDSPVDRVEWVLI
jgi:hypothetical protein